MSFPVLVEQEIMAPKEASITWHRRPGKVADVLAKSCKSLIDQGHNVDLLQRASCVVNCVGPVLGLCWACVRSVLGLCWV